MSDLNNYLEQALNEEDSGEMPEDERMANLADKISSVIKNELSKDDFVFVARNSDTVFETVEEMIGDMYADMDEYYED